MSRPRGRFLMWGPSPLRAIPEHPYRDTLIIYAVFGAVLGLIGWWAGTSGSHMVLAAMVWAAAVAWSLLGWRRRIQARARGEGLE